MNQTEQLKDFDNFFFYGYGELEDETRSDVLQNVMQPRRSLFYARNMDSAGLPEYENYPESMYKHIIIPYQVVESLSMRNQYVSNGSNDHPDRRVAVSQSTIRIEENKGEMNITILFIPLSDYKQTQQVNVPLGVSV